MRAPLTTVSLAEKEQDPGCSAIKFSTVLRSLCKKISAGEPRAHRAHVFFHCFAAILFLSCL
jgi:hypothetical protein